MARAGHLVSPPRPRLCEHAWACAPPLTYITLTYICTTPHFLIRRDYMSSEYVFH